MREEEGKSWIVRVEAEKNRLNPDCAVCKGKCGRTDNYDLEEMETDEPSDRARKEQILAELFPMAEKTATTSERNKESKTKDCRGQLIFCIRHCLRLETMSGKRVCRAWCRR